MTVRSEGQFNTVVYEEEDLYRHQERRDIILISPEDMERFGFKADQRVTVRNEVGVMRRQLVRPFDVREGNALMYYPESNVLVPRAVDPQSKTPAFKSIEVSRDPETIGSLGELSVGIGAGGGAAPAVAGGSSRVIRSGSAA